MWSACISQRNCVSFVFRVFVRGACVVGWIGWIHQNQKTMIYAVLVLAAIVAIASADRVTYYSDDAKVQKSKWGKFKTDFQKGYANEKEVRFPCPAPIMLSIIFFASGKQAFH